MKRAVIIFSGWLLFCAGSCLLMYSYLLDSGYGQGSAVLPSAVFCCFLQLLLTPLFLFAFSGKKDGAVIAVLATFAGSLIGCLAFSLLSPEIFIQVLMSQAVVFSFVIMIYSVFFLVSRIAGEKAGQLVAFIIVLVMLSSSFWTGGFDSLRTSPGADLAVWLCPQAMVSSAFDNFNYAHMPDVYGIWLGPVAPLPSSFWLAALMYAIPALMLHLLYFALMRFSSVISRENE